MNRTQEYYPKWGNPDAERHVWYTYMYTFTYKQKLGIKYRMPTLHATHPKKLNKKAGLGEDA